MPENLHFAAQPVSSLRFYLFMLSPALLVGLIGGISGAVSGEWARGLESWRIAGALLVTLNLPGAWLMYRPVGQFRADTRRSRNGQRRIRRLPALCALWTIGASMVALVAQYSSTYMLCDECPGVLPEPQMLLWPATLLMVYAGLLGIYTYFLIGDYTVSLRERLSVEQGLHFRAGRQRFLHRLLLGFAATSVMPIVLIYTHASVLEQQADLPAAEAGAAHVPAEPGAAPIMRASGAGKGMRGMAATAPAAGSDAAMGAHPMGPEGMATMREQMVMMQRTAASAALAENVVAALVLAVIAIVLITRALTRPVTTLMRTMVAAQQGGSKVSAPVVTDDEFGRLSVRFNTMLDGLRERQRLRETFGRFVPESIVATVLTDNGALTPRTVEATILFTDVEGFTAISERLTPEGVMGMLNEYFAVMAEPIGRYGGVITQFQGDAMLVSFNIPVAAEDHAANALRVAREIDRLQQERTLYGGFALRTRVGICTGAVVGGTVGNGDRLGYTVHGDTVNLAARLEQLNKDFGTRVLLSARTRELAGDRFDYRAIGPVDIRGHAESIHVYELL